MNAIKERPIVFSAPMVNAILRDTKTQTRRVVRPQPHLLTPSSRWYWQPRASSDNVHVDASRPWWSYALDAGDCPYGRRGDRLWVRETWRVEERDIAVVRDQQGPTLLLDYAANPGSPDLTVVPDAHRDVAARYAVRDFKWRPSIFMPRWVSRILLEITDVRAERVQDISEADALAEGIVLRQEQRPEWGGAWCTHYGLAHEDWHLTETKAAVRYRWLWQEINAKRGHAWESNPWVWVIEFRKVDG